MFISPKEYTESLKQEIIKRELELKELKDTYKKLAGSEFEPTGGDRITKAKVVASNLSTIEKISQAQKERHKKRRLEKLPQIVDYIKTNGPSSLAAISRDLKMTNGATKRILEENKELFKKNPNKLWSLK